MIMNSKIKTNDIVTLNYTGTLEDGQIFDQTKEPFILKIGSNLIFPKFEKKLIGMSAGEAKKFSLYPEEAYGPYDPHLLIEIPRTKLPSHIHIHVGMKISIPLKKAKLQYPMEIVAINDLSFTLDANHPLAGKVLHFEVEVLSIKSS